MGLTEREQQVLHELERQLSRRDRQLARALTTGRPRRRYGWAWICGATIVAGLSAVLIVEGTLSSQAVPVALGAVLLTFNAAMVAMMVMFSRRTDRF